MDSDRFDAFSRALHEARSRRGALATALGGFGSLLGLTAVEAGKGGKGGGGKGKNGKDQDKKKDKKKPNCNDELNEVPCGQECCNSLAGTTCSNGRCCEGTNGVCCSKDTRMTCHKTRCLLNGTTCCQWDGEYFECPPEYSCGTNQCPGVLAP